MPQPNREARTGRPQVSGWATGGVIFAASMFVMIGFFQAITGLVAIFDDDFFVVTRNYTFDLDTTAWGWIHLITGGLVLWCGLALIGNREWAGTAAVVIAILSAVESFFFIPYYPAWSILVIALDVWVIWALTRPGAVEDWG